MFIRKQIRLKYEKIKYTCRINIRKVELSQAEFVVVEISNFESSQAKDTKKESSSESLTISVLSGDNEDIDFDSFGQ